MKYLFKTFIHIKNSTLLIINTIFITSLFSYLLLFLFNIFLGDFITNFINLNYLLYPLGISLIILIFNNNNTYINQESNTLTRLFISIIGSFIIFFLAKELGVFKWLLTLSIFFILFYSTKNFNNDSQ